MGRATDPTADNFNDAASIPEGFRVTSIGAYHLLGWMPTSGYLDGMAFDTPLFSDATWDVMSSNSNSFDIGERMRRTAEFLRYLTEQWHASCINVSYFDWVKVAQDCEDSFAEVKRSLERRDRRTAGQGQRKRAPAVGGGTGSRRR